MPQENGPLQEGDELSLEQEEQIKVIVKVIVEEFLRQNVHPEWLDRFVNDPRESGFSSSFKIYQKKVWDEHRVAEKEREMQKLARDTFRLYGPYIVGENMNLVDFARKVTGLTPEKIKELNIHQVPHTKQELQGLIEEGRVAGTVRDEGNPIERPGIVKFVLSDSSLVKGYVDRTNGTLRFELSLEG